MTDTTITAIFASGMTALVAVIGGLPVLLVSITNLKQSRANAVAAKEEAELAKKKADEISRKADEIHTLTNSNLTKVTEALALANEKIQGMEKLLVVMSHKKANGGEEP